MRRRAAAGVDGRLLLGCARAKNDTSERDVPGEWGAFRQRRRVSGRRVRRGGLPCAPPTLGTATSIPSTSARASACPDVFFLRVRIGAFFQDYLETPLSRAPLPKVSASEITSTQAGHVGGIGDLAVERPRRERAWWALPQREEATVLFRVRKHSLRRLSLGQHIIHSLRQHII